MQITLLLMWVFSIPIGVSAIHLGNSTGWWVLLAGGVAYIVGNIDNKA